MRDEEDGLHFDSMGSNYTNEQALDCFLQVLELFRVGKKLYGDLAHKIYPDGICTYGEDVSGKSEVNLSAIPAIGSLRIVVPGQTADTTTWTEEAEEATTVQHRLWGLEPGRWYEAHNGDNALGRFQANGEGELTFKLSIEPGTTYEIKVK